MPFGGGPRICIGNRFAMIEAVLILTTLVQRFHFVADTNEPVVPIPSMTLRPVHAAAGMEVGQGAP